jgi:outer membrane protein TolC
LDNFYKENPALVSAKYSYQGSVSRKKVSLGRMLPNISFFAGFSRRVPDKSFWFKDIFNREYTWFYGVSLNFNIFNGFKDKKSYENAVISARMAEENMRLQELQNKNQLKYLYTRFHTLIKVREANLVNLEAVQAEYDLAQERYRVGSGTSLEVREAQVNLSQAEQALIESDYNLTVVYYQMKALLGEL